MQKREGKNIQQTCFEEVRRHQSQHQKVYFSATVEGGTAAARHPVESIQLGEIKHTFYRADGSCQRAIGFLLH